MAMNLTRLFFFGFIILCFTITYPALATDRLAVAMFSKSHKQWQLLVYDFTASKSGSSLQSNTTSPQVIPSIGHFRDFTLSPDGRELVYISSDSHLYHKSLQTGLVTKINPWDSKAKYTQPKFSVDGRLFAVRLPLGNSRSTQLIEIDVSQHKYQIHVAKRTSQFNPYMSANNRLYYTTALCIDDCEKPIWEIWYRDEFSGIQEQITLLNSLSRQPVFDSVNSRLYFQSDYQGYPKIWRMNGVTNQAQNDKDKSIWPELVYADKGQSQSHPTVDQKGNLFFISHTKQGDVVMKINQRGDVLPFTLPETAVKLRNLEVW